MTAHGRQALIGVGLACGVAAAWASLHVYAVFFLVPGVGTLSLSAAVVLLLCWLNVGLFIVAHDCMHGSLAPGRPRINTTVGTVCVALYAAFSYARLYRKHHEHHRYSGTERDPDFNHRHPRSFIPWYLGFFREYFSLREFAILTVILIFYIWGLGATIANVLCFWALPAIGSSLQLFYFGTFLPHRETAQPFGDDHRARSNEYSWFVSLVTCFHFGYHHEHHAHPHVPWWRLPQMRTAPTAQS
jgi:beta-carotene ketolase (CrtW type)